MAEEVGFEPTVPCGTTVFKTAAFDHSATPPISSSVCRRHDSREENPAKPTSGKLPVFLYQSALCFSREIPGKEKEAALTASFVITC